MTTSLPIILKGATPVVFSGLTLMNGALAFSSTGDTGYSDPGYAVDSAGVVHLKGVLTSVPGGDMPFAQLPVGARPIKRKMLTAMSSIGTVRIDIDGGGYLRSEASDTLYYLSLDHLILVAEQ